MPPDRLASPALPSLKPTTKAPRNRAFAGSFRFQEVYNLWGFTLYPQGSWVFCFSIQHVAHVECLNLLIITSHSTNIQTNECISVNQSYFNNLQIVAHCLSHFESNTKLLAWGWMRAQHVCKKMDGPFITSIPRLWMANGAVSCMKVGVPMDAIFPAWFMQFLEGRFPRESLVGNPGLCKVERPFDQPQWQPGCPSRGGMLWSGRCLCRFIDFPKVCLQ